MQDLPRGKGRRRFLQGKPAWLLSVRVQGLHEGQGKAKQDAASVPHLSSHLVQLRVSAELLVNAGGVLSQVPTL